MLTTYLQRTGATTGRLQKNTSHSSLEVIKKALLGQKQFSGGEQYLAFGNACHERFLVNSFKRKVSKEEDKDLKGMVAALVKDAIVNSLMKNSIREQKFYIHVNGVEMAMVLDIKQPHLSRGADLKTTNCKSLNEFIKKALEYGYVRQGVTYKKGAKLKSFYFIGVQKTPPYNVYLMNLADFSEEEAYAERELEFLLYFYKHYGKCVIQNDTTNLPPLQKFKQLK